ncbi:hypothetical protein KA005_34960 [bacterium]|nr:hypothetical protein [bacterium]
MIEIRDQFRKISGVLSALAGQASGTGHSGTTGQIRELIIHKFLRPHLPATIEIKSGVIFDSGGNRSSQQDCVLIDNRLPLIDIGSDTASIIIAESVIATIEVKSFLNKDELLSAVKSSAKTKLLVRKGSQHYKKGNALIISPVPLPILTYIFAYDGNELNTLQDHLIDFTTTSLNGHKFKSRDIPEAICILKRGVLYRSSLMPKVVGNEVKLPDYSKIQLQSRQYRKDALLAFYRRLIDDVIPVRMANYDFDAYYSNSDLE